MNKSAIRNFSTRARRKLIEDIMQKAYGLGIRDNGHYEDIEVFEGGFEVKNALVPTRFNDISGSVRKNREKLIHQIEVKDFQQVMEEMAYTWFNRIVAIRYMEVNGYLPISTRVLSSASSTKIEPDILTEIYEHAEKLKLDKNRVFDLKESNQSDQLYKEIFIRICNMLGDIMPDVFEKITDYTELLLPDNLLAIGSVIRDLVTTVDEDDFKEEVEIIGWMYQFYISEKKDEVLSKPKGQKYTKEEIPAVTQLFTPKWIVKYMTENSLGRLWQESHPNDDLKKRWEYYIEPAPQEEEVQKKLEALKNPNLSPEDIKVIDPAMGSGHILVYAFDVLYEVYLSRGYVERDIPQLIIEKNLYGLDIDNRAAQLAIFAVIMKARSKNKWFFRHKINHNLCAIQESNDITNESIRIFSDENQRDIKYLIKTFIDAKEYGSILKVEPVNFEALKNEVNKIRNNQTSLYEIRNRDEIIDYLPPLIKQGEILSGKYDVYITNPPYMGGSMNARLSEFVKKNYPDTKSDLYAVFMELDGHLVKPNGFVGMINQHSWMFLSSFEKYRKNLINSRTIISMLHLGPRTFEEIGGEVVQSTSYVLRKNREEDYIGEFIRLIDYKTSRKKEQKTIKAIENPECGYRYSTKTSSFEKIPSSPIAYWVNQKVLNSFSENNVGSRMVTREGMATADNDRFLRFWFEVVHSKIGFHFMTEDEFVNARSKWVPYNKGGNFRKWYGNNEYIVNWQNRGLEIKNNIDNLTGRIRSHNYNGIYGFKRGLTWSAISSGNFSLRFTDSGFLFDSKGAKGFPKLETDLYRLLALLNSKVSMTYLDFISPTLDFKVGDIILIPFKKKIDEYYDVLILIRENISISKSDWDSFETSWDFKTHPLIESNRLSLNGDVLQMKHGTIQSAFEVWKTRAHDRFEKLKSNEEELNRIFIEIYGLQDELTPEVDDKDVTVSLADETRDIKSFISYSLGCMFGRYSLDEEGLIYAGGEFSDDKYKTFKPVKDNVLVMTEEDYLENDILHRFVEFVQCAFGKENLEENLKYISGVLNPNSSDTARDIIRAYFGKDFYKDHLKTYKKRPIYWMLDSVKANGFKALFYLHRYDRSTIARIRTDYLHPVQRSYENDIELTSTKDDAKSKKKVENLRLKYHEVTEYDKLVAHLANKQIEMDLDDGVVKNYELFQGIEVPQSNGSKPVRADLLAIRK